MWSGPRNISTAMMRSFENRPDCAVVDEPFYAAYLAATGLDHPMREEVLASQPRTGARWRDGLAGRRPAAGLLPEAHDPPHAAGLRPGWTAACRNAFLIREPAQVLASYAPQRAEVTLADIGFVQQPELFDREADRLGRAPPVIEAADVLADPRGTLARAVRGARHRLPRGDARLARRPARHRRRLGPRLVRGGGALHRLRRAGRETAAPLTDDLREDRRPGAAALRSLGAMEARRGVLDQVALVEGGQFRPGLFGAGLVVNGVVLHAPAVIAAVVDRARWPSCRHRRRTS